MKFLFNNRKKLELILLGLIVLALIVCIGVELRYLGYKKANKEVLNAIKIVEEQTNIVTTKDDYDKMLKECRLLVYNEYTSSSVVDTDITIEEDTYVDSESQEEIYTNKMFNLANTVYCDGMLLTSFLNSSGEMKSVVAVIDKKADIIRATDISNISGFEKFNDYGTNSELDYIGNLIVSILKSDKSQLKGTITYKYFTSGGYKDFITELDDDNKVESAEIAFMKVGKSSKDMEYNDRIIIQLAANDSTRDIFINAIIKIDKNGKIFDIDII